MLCGSLSTLLLQTRAKACALGSFVSLVDSGSPPPPFAKAPPLLGQHQKGNHKRRPLKSCISGEGLSTLASKVRPLTLRAA
mmetsp:Transcript_72968/g.145100  ORF Transcript_72968/g.145100 Transcript_72968/m.145100 type:complete len:81 (+) Transcript_72968:136-378(+)